MIQRQILGYITLIKSSFRFFQGTVPRCGCRFSFEHANIFGLGRGIESFGGGLKRKHCWRDVRWTRTGARSMLSARIDRRGIDVRAGSIFVTKP